MRPTKDNLLDILVKTRTVSALDKAVNKSRAYQDTLTRQKVVFEKLENIGLSREQRSIIDNALSATNDCGAAYGTIAYRLGLQDGIKLVSELAEIK